MNDHGNIKFRLKAAEMYLQYLKEDLDLTKSLDESIASQINQLLKEARKLLRESVNLLNLEVREARKKYGGSHP